MFRRVAIIGGGAAGASLLSELLERPLSQPLHLDWFTGPGTPGRGVAYGTASERHLLNVRAASMGMFANRPGGFLQYVQQRDSAVNGTDFLPRRWYGDYLEAEVANAIERARAQGHSVRLVPYNVEAVVPEDDGVTLFQGETATHVEAAVLALGALAPRPLPHVPDEALASGRYVIDPWALLREARDSSQPQHVLVIGMGLTAVDTIVELAAKWPNARFTCISRHGLLPEQHLQHAALPFEDAEELVEGMQDAPDIRTWLHMLREAIEHAPDWRQVVDCLRPYSTTLWGLLPPADRARFMRHARWAWERVRHRLPPQVGASIRALEQSGRLTRLAGRMQAVDVTENGLRLRYRPRYASSEVSIDADLIVQSVGLETNVSRAHDPLLQQMMTNGHIQADPLGLGLATMPDGRVLHKGEPWQRLFAMGSLVRGALWECTAMPEIRQQSRHLADLLLMDHDEDDD